MKKSKEARTYIVWLPEIDDISVLKEQSYIDNFFSFFRLDTNIFSPKTLYIIINLATVTDFISNVNHLSVTQFASRSGKNE